MECLKVSLQNVQLVFVSPTERSRLWCRRFSYDIARTVVKVRAWPKCKCRCERMRDQSQAGNPVPLTLRPFTIFLHQPSLVVHIVIWLLYIPSSLHSKGHHCTARYGTKRAPSRIRASQSPIAIAIALAAWLCSSSMSSPLHQSLPRDPPSLSARADVGSRQSLPPGYLGGLLSSSLDTPGDTSAPLSSAGSHPPRPSLERHRPRSLFLERGHTLSTFTLGNGREGMEEAGAWRATAVGETPLDRTIDAIGMGPYQWALLVS